MLTIDEDALFTALVAGIDIKPDVPDVDPWTLLAGMHLSEAAYKSCRDTFLRYLAGEPLVRKHHRLDEGWSFLCPDPYCMKWQVGFDTPGACRAGWFQHCDDRPHGFTPSWPASIPFEPVYQPIAEMRGSWLREGVEQLVKNGTFVDLAGRPMRYERCPCPTIVGDYKVSGLYNHQLLVGATCANMVTCPKCGMAPGYGCDRKAGPLYGRGAHTERDEAADEDEQRRAAAGDLRVPAPWRPDLAPTARRPRHRPKPPTAVLRARLGKGDNAMFDDYIREMAPTGRLTWDDSREQRSCSVLYDNAKAAKRAASFMSQLYGIDAALFEVEEITAPLPCAACAKDARARKELVQAEARRVLSSTTMDGPPEEHLAWAAGVEARVMCWTLVTDFKPKDISHEYYGTPLDNGHSTTQTRASFLIEWYKEPTRESREKAGRKLTWARIAKAIKGKIPGWLLAEMKTALDETMQFPLYSQEWERARRWCDDLVYEAWALVRPASLPETQ